VRYTMRRFRTGLFGARRPPGAALLKLRGEKVAAGSPGLAVVVGIGRAFDNDGWAAAFDDGADRPPTERTTAASPP